MQQESQAERLKKELEPFFKVEIMSPENWNGTIILFYNGKRYRVFRNQKGFVLVLDWVFYSILFPFLSFYTIKKIEEKNKTNNIKVISKEKILKRIEAIELEKGELKKLNDEAGKIRASFLRKVELLKLKGLPFSFCRLGCVDSRSIYSGSCVLGGLVFNFELQADGIIKENIKLDPYIDKTLENFLALSKNKYKKRLTTV